MEQKLVQRCETEIVADACNASYAISLEVSSQPCFRILRGQHERYRQKMCVLYIGFSNRYKIVWHYQSL